MGTATHSNSASSGVATEAIDKIRAAFACHPDLSIVVHPGAVHGFSHDGDAYDESACQAGLDATGTLLESLA